MRALAPFAALLAGLTACGPAIGTPDVDPRSVEKAITADLKAQGAAPRSVTCPGGHAARRGAAFDCAIVAADGTRTVAHVTFTSRERFDYRVTPGG
jgi:hypothetical protein